MDIRELREMTDEQLTDVFEDMKEQLYRLRLNHATGELVDTSQFRNTRRAIARALTVLRERQIAAGVKKG
jgi:large subunit ribosomal protein L29